MNIILRIMGGLGNQLFQYAAMRAISVQNPNSKMFIDSRGYSKVKDREYELANFALIKNIEEYNRASIKYDFPRELYHIYQFCYYKLRNKYAPMVPLTLQKKGLFMATTNYKIPTGFSCNELYMYGYFINYSQFKSIKPILEEEVRLIKDLSSHATHLKEMILSENDSVGVSVRCAEGWANLGWPVCTKEFYCSGMRRIKEAKPDAKFFVFADEIEMIKRKDWFSGFDVTYVDACTVTESFELLKNCKNFVISNSSFCWWAAWLASNEDKIVYSTNKFYENSPLDDSNMIFEDELFLDYITGEPVR